MPMKSKAQRRFLWATDPELARRFEDHTPAGATLPDHVPPKKGSERMDAISRLAKEAADGLLVDALAADSRLTPEAVRHVAAACGLPPGDFAKMAYADPDDYVACVGVVSGRPPAGRVKAASRVGGLLSRALEFMRDAGKAAVGKGPMQGGAFGVSEATSKPGLLLQKLPTGQSQAGRAATGAGIAGSAATAANEVVPGRRFSSPPKAPAQPPAAKPPAQPQSQPQSQPPAGGPGEALPAGGGGLSPAGKALLAGGAVGAGYLGAKALMPKKKKEVTAAEAAVDFLRGVVLKVAKDKYRAEAASAFAGYLDKVAAVMPAEKTAQVRRLQSEVLAGKTLAQAIKVAYPQLSGEQRGLLAARMVRAACATKTADVAQPFRPGFKTAERKEHTFKVKGSDAGAEMKKLG